MFKLLFHVFIFLFSVYGFGQNPLTITIDSACLNNNNMTKLNGELGLYGTIKIAQHPFWVNDTILKKLAYKKEPTISLELLHTIKFKPDNSNQKTHIHYIYPQDKKIHLNCFFFHKKYPSFINEMKNNDFIVFSSHYYGDTNIESIISIYTLTIKKKHGKFYALYTESQTNEQGFIMLDLAPNTSYKKNQVKLTKDFILLTDSDIQVIKEFEKNLNSFYLDHYTGNDLPTSKTNIKTKNNNISFFAQGYISTLLWNKIKD